MKHKPNEKQQEKLLNRHADQAHLQELPVSPMCSVRRIVLEAPAGLIFGVSFGISLYYVIAILYYYAMLCLGLLVLALCSIFHIPDSLPQGFLKSLDYGPVVDVLLAFIAVVFIFYFTRGTIRQGYPIFAWVQLPLTLLGVIYLFYLTLIHHRPLFPFYEQ